MKNNNKIIRFAQALILLPIVSVSGSAPSVPTTDPIIKEAFPVVVLQKNNMGGSLLTQNDQAAKQAKAEAEALREKAEAIDTYFRERDMPLAGYGMKMAMEAEKNNLDWRLIAAIAVRESTGGKFECKKAEFNAFGWGSCKIDFKSHDDAIETVARNLGGNNPKTARHYADKTTLEILRAYNPPSIVPRYGEQVIAIMNSIGPEFVVVPGTEANS